MLLDWPALKHTDPGCLKVLHSSLLNETGLCRIVWYRRVSHSSSSLACLSISSACSSALCTRSLSASERRSVFSVNFWLAPSIAAWYCVTFCAHDGDGQPHANPERHLARTFHCFTLFHSQNTCDCDLSLSHTHTLTSMPQDNYNSIESYWT